MLRLLPQHVGGEEQAPRREPDGQHQRDHQHQPARGARGLAQRGREALLQLGQAFVERRQAGHQGLQLGRAGVAAPMRWCTCCASVFSSASWSSAVGPDGDRIGHEADVPKAQEELNHGFHVVGVVAAVEEAQARGVQIGRRPAPAPCGRAGRPAAPPARSGSAGGRPGRACRCSGRGGRRRLSGPWTTGSRRPRRHAPPKECRRSPPPCRRARPRPPETGRPSTSACAPEPELCEARFLPRAQVRAGVPRQPRGCRCERWGCGTRGPGHTHDGDSGLTLRTIVRHCAPWKPRPNAASSRWPRSSTPRWPWPPPTGSTA